MKANTRRWIRTIVTGLGLALGIMGQAQMTWADVYEVAPPGRPTSADIWPSLEALLQSGIVSGGDEIVMQAGSYGKITIKGARFSRAVTIRATTGAQVHLAGLVIDQSHNLILDGMQVWPEQLGQKGHIVRATRSTRAIVLRNLEVRGRVDAAGYPGWSKQAWEAGKRSGVLLRGPQSAVLNSTFTGLDGAIDVAAGNARIEGNVIRGFSQDGVQIAADNVTVRGNRIEDCVKINDNHDDGIQAWSLGPDGKPGRGTLKNLTIENNIILEWRGRNAPALTCDLQGIGLFDGMYQGLSITNNLVMVSAYHGISVYGGIDSVIANNTVLHRTGAGADRPWIGVFPHKDKRPARRMVVANNIAPKYTLAPESTGLINRQNLVEPYPAKRLQAPYDGDFTPKADSGLVDAAAPTHAPARDVFGRARGTTPDLGAVERP